MVQPTEYRNRYASDGESWRLCKSASLCLDQASGESDGNYPGSVYNGVTSTTGDPNCDPAHSNALANSQLTDAMAIRRRQNLLDCTVRSTRRECISSAVIKHNTGFTIAATGVSVEQGTNATTSVTISDVNGFAAAVDLTIMPARWCNCQL